MNIYVASRTSEIARVQRMQNWLREDGHTISFDWTVDPASGIRDDWSDDVPAARERSMTERDAILNSNALVILWRDGACGALLETGMAMGYLVTPMASPMDKVIVSGATRESVFFYLPKVTLVDYDPDVIPALRG